jgi:3-methyladenine DNA glycosylase AlkD
MSKASALMVEAERDALIAQLQAQADPTRAASEKRYLKSDLNFYGVTVPTLNKMVSAWAKAHRDAPIVAVAALAAALWESGWHEERTLGVFLLEAFAAQLTLEHLPHIERMMRQANTWAHIDEIAVHLAGALLARYPAMRDHLLRWAVDDHFWVRRTAVLAQNTHFRRGGGDFTLFEQISAPMLDEDKGWAADERFFIRKAIGWALREMCKHYPDWVVDYVQRHRARMSGLTFREATRKLPADMRAKIG